ncbi:hypothetical protein [Staphylothermus hellenicus]|uniref:Uncharacterized protein n=1 Tax=Staphylothermus hellenicus (strain DSM 12710 / JCM 10830 / BK20S6-10-b1 / P8) TaxID=591019 RepID=D7D9D3_STAHD|nr:hypothetical protein [Staphylothermus hellenicus]ADI32379.1 hypothetical protein Shell_1286 [Staphylothermus hellenicus DSM 12710]
MLILLYGMMDKALVSGKDIRKLIISPRYSKRYDRNEQIIIEDVGFPRYQPLTTRGFDSIAYSCKLSSLFLKGVKFYDEKIEILVNGSEGFDLGTTLSILQDISRYEKIPEIYLFVETPGLKNSSFILGRFYAWLKTLFLYDIFFNSIREGAMKIVFLLPEQPPQIYKLLVDLAEKAFIEDSIYSLIDLRIKRFLFPILDLLSLSKILSIRGRVEELLREYKIVLLLINYLLGEAPPDLWDIARKDKKTIQRSIFPYKKLSNKINYLDENLRKIIALLEKRDDNYTVLAMDPKLLFEKLLSGINLSSIYKSLNLDDLIEKISNIPPEQLIRLYKEGHKSAIKGIWRKVFISEDIARGYTKKDNIVVVYGRVNEIVVADYGLVTMCEDCNIPSYLPLEYRNAYYEKIGVFMDTYFPEHIKVNKVEFSPGEIHDMKLLNYPGYLLLREKGKENLYKSLFDKIRKATYREK